MKNSINELMRDFQYDDKRITNLLAIFDDLVRSISDYDDQFQLDSKEHEKSVLSGYRNSAFGILLSLFQLGHITTADFHYRIYALNSVFFNKSGY